MERDKTGGRPPELDEILNEYAPPEDRSAGGAGRGKVIDFPQEDRSLTGRIEKLRERADAYAEQMFPDDAEPDPREALRDKLLPGVDYEEELTHAPRARRKRLGHRKPDTSPMELARKYGKGLGFLRVRTLLSLLWCLPQLYLMAAPGLGLPTLPFLSAAAVRCRTAAAALGVSGLLGLDVLGYGLLCLVRLRLEGETVLVFAFAAALADALTMPWLGTRGGAMPYCGVVALALFFALWGRFIKRRSLRLSCRVAAMAKTPYRITVDEKMWNGEDAFAKCPGEVKGFGSQVQEPDGVQRGYHIAAPAILVLSAALALTASVGRAHPEHFLWSLSACLTAGCGFGAFLAFAVPFSGVTRRLGKIGAALGGWDGLRLGRRGVGAVLTDGDLFPPGSVTLNGIKLMGNYSLETLAAYAASLIRESGSGMEKPFVDLLRSQGNVLRRCGKVVFHEGGVTGLIGGRPVYVGSGAFMTLMEVEIPQGLNVKNAVFCAVDGRLEGIFALNYKLHFTVRPALAAMLRAGLRPIMATRDFNIIPEMLRQRFKLPADKLDFPSSDRRRELSSKRQEHAPELAALLCREGLGPYAEAVVGGRRLVRSARLGLFFALLGAAVGMALAFYLTASAAYAALSAEAVLVFLLLWLVPILFVSGWANRY